jgi:hypothetical protein
MKKIKKDYNNITFFFYRGGGGLKSLTHQPISVVDPGMFIPDPGSRVKKIPDPGSVSASKN